MYIGTRVYENTAIRVPTLKNVKKKWVSIWAKHVQSKQILYYIILL